eukprot:5524757-Prymnesium_polylepis.2
MIHPSNDQKCGGHAVQHSADILRGVLHAWVQTVVDGLTPIGNLDAVHERNAQVADQVRHIVPPGKVGALEALLVQKGAVSFFSEQAAAPDEDDVLEGMHGVDVVWGEVDGHYHEQAQKHGLADAVRPELDDGHIKEEQ